MAIEFDTEKGDDLDTIRQRLTDAMAWFEFASRTAEPGFPRSPRLVPSALEHNRKRVLASVAYKRKAAIEGAGGTEAG